MKTLSIIKTFSKQLLAAALVLGLAALSIFFISQSSQAAFYGGGSWQYRQKITIQASEVDSQLTDFPVYVDLADMQSGFFSNVRSDGGDIRITKADGSTELAREVVAIDTASSTGEIHFKADSLSATTNTDFYIYYGNSSATDYADSATYGAENVWTNGYEAVWHNAGTADSTSNNNNGTTNGGVSVGGVSGAVGSATELDGVDDYIDFPNAFSTLTEGTLSAWIRTNGSQAGGRGVFSISDSTQFAEISIGRSDINEFEWALKTTNDNNARTDATSPSYPDDQWHLMHMRVTSSVGNTMFVNGVEPNVTYANGSETDDRFINDFAFSTSPRIGLVDLSGGSFDSYYEGQADEVRVNSVPRAADWIAAEYSNQNTPTSFYTAGTQEADNSTTPVVSTQAASNIATSSATGNGNITDTGTTTPDERGFVWDTAAQPDPGNTAPGSSSYANSVNETGSFGTGTFSNTLSGLTAETTYYYRAYAHNSAGYRYGSEVSFTTNNIPPDIITSIIKADGTGDYQTIAAWEAATDNDLVAANQVQVGLISDTATYAERVTIAGATTDSTNYRRLSVAQNFQHDGTAGSGPVVDPATDGIVFTIDEDYFESEWLEVTGWSGNSSEAYRINGDEFRLRYGIIHDALDTNSDGVYINSDGITAHVQNSVFYDINRTSVHIQIRQNVTVNVTNVTIYNITTEGTSFFADAYGAIGFDQVNGSNSGSVMVLQNVTSEGGEEDFLAGAQGGSFAGSDYNASADGTAPGANSLTGVIQADQFVSLTDGAEDFHLKAGADLIDAGTDLANQFETDIDGETRTTSWDIGADEYNTAPTITTVTDTPDPVTEGNNITFSVDWDDADGDGVKTYICKTDSVTAGSGCDGGEWTSQSASFAQTDPQEPTYTTQSADVGTNDYFAFVCDSAGACSGSTSGTFDVDAAGGGDTTFGDDPSGTFADTDWQYRQKITIQASEVAANLTDFPVYVDLSDLGTSFFNNVNSDGGDIRMTTSDGTTEIAREVVSVDTGSNSGELHFKAPTLSSSQDTDFYIYYGNSSATDYADSATYGAENVWADYLAVYHLEEDPAGTAPQFTDVTGNTNDLTANGNPQSTNFPINTGLDFDGAGDYLNGTPSSQIKQTGSITVSAWYSSRNVEADNFMDADIGGVTRDNQLWEDGWGIGHTAAGEIGFFVNAWDGNSPPSGTSGAFVRVNGFSNNTNYHLVARYNQQNVSLFVDGAENIGDAYTGAIAYEIDTTYEVGRLGSWQGGSLDGQLGEFRYSGIALSDDWISAEYTNQNTPTTFYATGAQEAEGDAPGAGGGPATTSSRIRGGSTIRGGSILR